MAAASSGAMPELVARGGPMNETHFLRHLFEMTVAMMIGMVASAALFVTALGMTVDEALRRHAVAFVVVQAFGMTISMVAWMRHRRSEYSGHTVLAPATLRLPRSLR